MKNLLQKLKNFYTEKKKSILGALWIVLGVIGISLATFIVLLLCDVVYFEDGGMQFNLVLFEALKASWWGSLIFVVLQTVLTMLL